MKSMMPRAVLATLSAGFFLFPTLAKADWQLPPGPGPVPIPMPPVPAPAQDHLKFTCFNTYASALPQLRLSVYESDPVVVLDDVPARRTLVSVLQEEYFGELPGDAGDSGNGNISAFWSDGVLTSAWNRFTVEFQGGRSRLTGVWMNWNTNLPKPGPTPGRSSAPWRFAHAQLRLEPRSASVDFVCTAP